MRNREVIEQKIAQLVKRLPDKMLYSVLTYLSALLRDGRNNIA